MKSLDKCPDWPAVLDTPTAVLYLGGKARLLYALIAAGYLTPMGMGHRATHFLRQDLDSALVAARAAGDKLQAPGRVASVAGALRSRASSPR